MRGMHLCLLLASVGLAWLTGCEQSGRKAPGVIAGTETDHENARSWLFRVNSGAKQKYALSLKISDAPGPIELATGYAEYQAFNCRYVISKLMGVGGNPRVYLPVEVSAAGPNEFRAIVALDAMKDADYYGTGTCRWQLTLVALDWSGAKVPKMTKFSTSVVAEEVVNGTPHTQIYPKKFYPTSPFGDVGYSGLSEPQIAELEDRSTVFSAVINSKEMGDDD